MHRCWLAIAFACCMHLSASQLTMNVAPDEIITCPGSQLTLTCEFDIRNISLYHLVSLSLYRTENGVLTEDMASIDSFSGTPHLDPKLIAKASGMINDNSSFLMLEFPNAREEDAGDFECLAHAVDFFGHPQTYTAAATVVDVHPQAADIAPEVEDDASRLRQLQLVMEKHNNGSSYGMFDNWFVSTSRDGRHYLVPKEELSMDIAWLRCAQEGGYFVEINDEPEYQFVRNFLNGTVMATITTSHRLFVTGSMDTGTEFVFLRHPGDPMFLDFGWSGNYPRDIYYCVSLVENVDFRMVGTMCEAYDVSYICEVPETQSA